MDVNTLTNAILIGSGGVFIAVIAYRIGSGIMAGRRAEESAGPEILGGMELGVTEDRTEITERATIAEPIMAERRRPAVGTPSSVAATQLFSSVVEEEEDAIRSSARTMVDYSLVRGGVSHVRPQILEKLAIQFGILEAALRRASVGSTGEPCILPDELRSEMFREGFRIVVSQSRK